ncbi:MAG TPA: hypothetical protein EYP64_06475 [Desulfarculaceae bacterium]|nr:hypothetical protein [Desulfarculaceae bacterium]
MKFTAKLVLLTGLICLLANVAGLGTAVANPDLVTKGYIDAWNFPTDDNRSESSGSMIVEDDRERMISNDTDEYKRSWNLPNENGKKTAPASKSQPVRPLAPPPDDTDEYINGWTFE